MAKQVINGKRYNTETAECVSSWSNGHFTTDFKYRSKDLYRTPNGNWFMHHCGGAMTDMAQWHGNSCSYGERIEPLAEKEAFAFLQEQSDHSDAAAAIEKYFPASVTDA